MTHESMQWWNSIETIEGQSNWGMQQYIQYLERVPPDLITDRNLVGLLNKYAFWIIDIKKARFSPIRENLSPQVYSTQKRGNFVRAIHRDTFLWGEGKDTPIARQNLEVRLNQHIQGWNDHPEEINKLDRYIDEIVVVYYSVGGGMSSS